MHSNRSENSHRWQDRDRSLRQWDEYNRRVHPHSKIPRDSHHKNRGDGHSSTEKMSRSREYSNSPKRQSSKDSVNRDWSRKSPVRRRVSSPVWDASEKRSQRYSEDADRDFRYKHESMEKKSRLSPDRFSHNHKSKDFKYAPAREDDFKGRRTPPDFRFRHPREEFAQRKQHEDSSDRGFSDRFDDKKDRKRKWEHTPERPQSPDRFTKIYVKTRERMDNPHTSVYQEDYHQNREMVPVNGFSRQSFESDATPQSASVPERKLSRGFQRFLNVLNKGVNVDALTKIVSQTSTEVTDECVPQSSFVNAADRSWSPGCTERQQTLQHNSSWSGRKGTLRLPSPQPDPWSLSPSRQPASDEELLQRTEGRVSPPSVEKSSLTPQDEEKRKQMQDVLQAIGVDLGFEELGQMSHRIQERLYGKKDGERGRKLSRERSTRRTFTSRNQSRSSSSSGSSFSPMTRDCFVKKDSCSPARDLTDVREAQVQRSAEYSQTMSSSFFQDSEKCKTSSQESTATWNVFPPTSTYTLTQPPPAPLTSTYSPISRSPLPNPMLPTAPHPVLPNVGPGLFLPRLPPLLPHAPVPPNFLPSLLAQTRHVLPPPPPLVSPLDVQATNKTQKSKILSRPRCLHVIK